MAHQLPLGSSQAGGEGRILFHPQATRNWDSEAGGSTQPSWLAVIDRPLVKCPFKSSKLAATTHVSWHRLVAHQAKKCTFPEFSHSFLAKPILHLCRPSHVTYIQTWYAREHKIYPMPTGAHWAGCKKPTCPVWTPLSNELMDRSVQPEAMGCKLWDINSCRPYKGVIPRMIPIWPSQPLNPEYQWKKPIRCKTNSRGSCSTPCANICSPARYLQKCKDFMFQHEF